MGDMTLQQAYAEGYQAAVAEARERFGVDIPPLDPPMGVCGVCGKQCTDTRIDSDNVRLCSDCDGDKWE